MHMKMQSIQHIKTVKMHFLGLKFLKRSRNALIFPSFTLIIWQSLDLIHLQDT